MMPSLQSLEAFSVQRPELPGQILELLESADAAIGRYQLLCGWRGLGSARDAAETEEAFDWIRVAIQDITATLEAISGPPSLSGEWAPVTHGDPGHHR